MKLTRIRFEFKLADFWIGVFWKTTNCITDEGDKPMFTDIWVCFIPCFPLHITVMHKVEVKF